MNLLSDLLAFTARQIGLLKTNLSGITTRMGTAESNITGVTTRVNNIVATNSNSAVTLYNNPAGFFDGTITLAQPIANFDFIDIFYLNVGSGTDRGGHSTRIPAVAGTYELRTWDADPPSSDFSASIECGEQTVTISGSTFTASSNKQITFSIASQSSVVVNTGIYRYTITKIVGIKMGNASPAELTDIRVDSSGTVYASAGDATRALSAQIEDAQVGVDITARYAMGYIPLALSIGSTVNIDSPTSSGNYAYCVVPCKAGERFKITGTGGSTPRVWAFIDSSYKLLSVANAEATATDLMLKAKQDGYFISDVYYARDHQLVHYYNPSKENNEFVQKNKFKEINNIVQIQQRYARFDNNGLSYGTAFTCTNLIKVNPGDTLKVATAVGDSVGIAGYDANKNYISRICDVNTSSLYPARRSDRLFQFEVPSNVYYICVSNTAPTELDISVQSDNPDCNIENPEIDMLIVPRYGTTSIFDLYIRTENGKDYLRHHFTKQYYTDTLSYGDGLTKSVVGANIWYSDSIYHDTIQVMAGNFNFIHNISNMTGHNGYVGAGHGCTVADWMIFYADGKTIDPESLILPEAFHTFDFIFKANNYLIDKPNSPSESHAVPTLDSNGDPIVTSVNIINAKMRVGNQIEYRNRMIFKMDGIQFSECHGSMCEGYFAAFDNLVIENNEESWNYIDASNDYARTKMNGTQWDLFTAGSKKANTVVMFGDKYRVENKLLQLDGSRNKITNTRTALYRDNGARMKVYLMPVVTTISSQNIADGASVETFNIGDTLDVTSYRKITIS